MEAHAYDLRAEVDDAQWVEQIKSDYTAAKLDDADRALCDYAFKLTRTPAAVTDDDVAGLRELGFDDRAINDAAQVIAFFNYINRIADGLGVDPEPGRPQACSS